jgi:hypothetical protein
MRNLTLILLICVSFAAHAGDKKGNFAVWGPGVKSCFSYTSARKAEKYDAYKYFIMGYLTAYNTLTPDTYRISGNDRFIDVMKWLDDYCQKQPVHGFEQAVNDYVVHHQDSRLSEPPPTHGR